MGQYFKAVNLDRREVVCPWCMGGLAKHWEWAANSYGGIFTLLLLKHGSSHIKTEPKSRRSENMQEPTHSSLIMGRWAGDRVYLVGDSSEPMLYRELDSFTNISRQVTEEWNDFICIKRLQLIFKHCGCSSPLLDCDSQR